VNERGFVVIALAACLLAAVGIITTAAVKANGNDKPVAASGQSIEKPEIKEKR